ncbi:MAG: ParA family protein [Candidatus Promineifilaceae bacterium]
MGIIIAVLNRKGGTGKTTTAVTLAQGMASKLREQGSTEDRVMLIDLDPQSNCAPALGVEQNDADLSYLILRRQTLRDAIIQARPSLFLIPSSDKLTSAVTRLSKLEVLADEFETPVAVNDVLQTYLGQLADRCACMILDCPPSLGQLERAVFQFATHIVIPATPKYLGTVGVARLTRNILDYNQTATSKLKLLAIVPTQFDKRRLLDREMLADLQSAYGQAVVEPIPFAIKAAEAPSFGQTVLEYAPSSKPAQAYQKLVEHVYQEVKV